MPSIPLPLVGPTYADESISFGVEESINWFAEISGSEGTRAKFMLRTHAGLTAFATSLAGAGRGVREAGGVFYVVAGETLYSIDSGGVATSLGTILGGGRCSMTDNFVPDTRRQVVILTGERGYVYDTSAGLSEITDPDFVDYADFQTAAFVDNYILVSTEDGIIYSAITDATQWAALDFKTAESSPDKVVAVWPVYGDAWVFGARTIEVLRTTSDTDNVFQTVQTIEKGCGARYSPANADNAVFWIDETGRVYRANGFNPIRVSTHAIEQYLQSVDHSEAFGFSYVDRGHEFYGFTVPGGRTFLYDCATGLWNRRKSEHVERWRISAQARCYGMNLFADYETGTVWKLDTAAVWEGNDRLIRERISGYLHADGKPIFISTLDLIAETGNALQVGDPEETEPKIEIRYCDKRGRDWSNWKQRDLGRIGEYGKRLRWHRLGRTRQRAFHVRISDPIRCDLIAASMTLEPGDQA